MCYNCGCKLPYESHGDKDNIVEDHLAKSGQTEAVKHSGTKTAKENIMELLELQRERNELDQPKKDYSS